MNEALSPHMLDKRNHRIPEAFNIGEYHRLFMPPKLRPGHDLDDFLDCADATGKGDECVGVFEQRMFALVHILCDDEL
jgi:hypothetical protein